MKELTPDNFDFIGRIKADGSGIEKVPDSLLVAFSKNEFLAKEKYKVFRLSMTNKTFIAIGFNSFVVKIKSEKQ